MRHTTIALGICTALLLSGCNITKNNHPPKIHLVSKSVDALVSTKVYLDARVTDKDNDLKRVSWRQVEGPATAELITDQGHQAEILLPVVAGRYRFEILAEDRKGNQSTAIATIEGVSLEEGLYPQLDALFDEVFQAHQERVLNMATLIDFKTHQRQWTAGLGSTREALVEPMTPRHRFRIASISKTFTAALALKLAELGYLTLDTPIGELISDEQMPSGFQVADLHVMDGVRRGESLTVRQLLDQSTGIRDYMSYLTDPASPDFMVMMAALADQQQGLPRPWTSDQLILNLLSRGMTMDLQHLPGEAHLYGNSNTDLLAWILERHLGQPFHQLLQDHVLTPLALQDTYLEYHQAASGEGPVDHHWWIDENEYPELPDAMYGNHNVLVLDVDTSIAWAGGGLVSTLQDLNAFFAAMESGQWLTDPVLQNEWHEYWPTVYQNDEFHYAYGLGRERIEVQGLTLRGHGGFWGSNAVDVEPLDIRIIGWNSQVESAALDEFINGAIGLMLALGLNGIDMAN